MIFDQAVGASSNWIVDATAVAEENLQIIFVCTCFQRLCVAVAAAASM